MKLKIGCIHATLGLARRESKKKEKHVQPEVPW